MNRTKLFLAVSASLFTMAASGQSYSIDWCSSDGGGATSTGGGYSMNGVFGQLDAGLISGGGYRLSFASLPGTHYTIQSRAELSSRRVD